MGRRTLLAAVLLLALTAPAAAQNRPSPDEPMAGKLSVAKASQYLEGAATGWMRKHNCMACHTGYAYVMAGPSFGSAPAPGLKQMRQYLETRVTNWDRGQPGDAPDPGDEGVTEVVATATTFAFEDAQTSGKLRPLTRKALDRMWTIQQENGAWDWNKHRLPPLEYDEYFGAVFAALGVGIAPEGYARSDGAKAGLAKLRDYLKKNPPPNLHHRLWLLWASQKLEGLMTADEQKQTVDDLLRQQTANGGWKLSSLGDWKRHDGSSNKVDGPPDGYATGLAVYVLRQAGRPANDAAMQQGIAWLKSNQRESGRWYTRSLSADRDHYITNAGTAFAVMALKACEPEKK